MHSSKVKGREELRPYANSKRALLKWESTYPVFMSNEHMGEMKQCGAHVSKFTIRRRVWIDSQSVILTSKERSWSTFE